MNPTEEIDPEQTMDPCDFIKISGVWIRTRRKKNEKGRPVTLLEVLVDLADDDWRLVFSKALEDSELTLSRMVWVEDILNAGIDDEA